MNINELQAGSFNVVKQGSGAPLNVNTLPQGSFSVTPPPQQPPQPNLLQKLGTDVTDTVGAVGNRITQGGNALNDVASGQITAPEGGLRIFGQVVGAANDVIGGATKGALQTANAATGGLAGKAATGTLQAIAKTPLGAMGINAIQGGATKWQSFAEQYPRAAQDLQAVPEAAQLLLNIGVVGDAAKGVQAAAPLVKSAANAGVDTVKGVSSSLAERATAKSLQNTLDAVNPELKGTKLTNAYKDIVSGSRDSKGGTLTQQTLSASPREQDVGKRLFDAGIKLSNNPVKDLGTLRTALSDTETKLEATLKGDPELVFNADKPTLITKLNSLKSSTPRDFRIGEEGKKFGDVINFGKQVIGQSEDTVTGLRDARSAFDAQAKLQYPTAFKDGVIDTKTPAGNAIKLVRNTINDHLYDTAPAGSEVKKLIGTEADIFRARDAIAPKAASTHGTNILERAAQKAKEHPIIALGAGYEGLKHTVAPQLPGF